MIAKRLFMVACGGKFQDKTVLCLFDINLNLMFVIYKGGTQNLVRSPWFCCRTAGGSDEETGPGAV